MAGNVDADDGFVVSSTASKNKKRNGSNVGRTLYVGGLRSGIVDVASKIRDLLQQHDLDGDGSADGRTTVQSIQVKKNGKNQHALLECGDAKQADDIMRKLNGSQLEDCRLVVQHKQEKKGGKNSHKNNKGKSTSSFGSWSKPKTAKQGGNAQSSMAMRPNDGKVTVTDGNAATQAGRVSSPNMDAIMAGMMNASAVKPATAATASASTNTSQGTNFRARCAMPLSNLLADFGEQDLSWKKMEPVVDTTQTQGNNISRLAQQGKAPISVEFCSFGFFHGAPPEIRAGWSHSNPMAVQDCRDFPLVAANLEGQDGQSNTVKRNLFDLTNGEIQDSAQATAKETIRAIHETQDAGYGYALPIRMAIYAGSDFGRHRSVAYCEMAATALRDLLRKNHGSTILQPVSVSLRHIHVNRRIKQGQARRRNENDNPSKPKISRDDVDNDHDDDDDHDGW